MAVIDLARRNEHCKLGSFPPLIIFTFEAALLSIGFPTRLLGARCIAKGKREGPRIVQCASTEAGAAYPARHIDGEGSLNGSGRGQGKHRVFNGLIFFFFSLTMVCCMLLHIYGVCSARFGSARKCINGILLSSYYFLFFRVYGLRAAVWASSAVPRLRPP